MVVVLSLIVPMERHLDSQILWKSRLLLLPIVFPLLAFPGAQSRLSRNYGLALSS